MIQYLLTVSICWLALYVVYYLFLRRETFFSINRAYLMTSLIAGLLIPAYQWIPASVYTHTEAIPYIYDLSETVVLMSPVQETSMWSWTLVLSTVYLLGVLIMGAKLVHGLRRILQLRYQADIAYVDGLKVFYTNRLHLPFSFWQSIYISKELPLKEEVMSVLQHEKVHIREWHSLDILLIELMHVFFWFNPILIFYKKAIQQSHEYVADATVIQDIPRKSYGQLLLKQSQSGLEIALANHFFHSQVKKRITMMYQEKSKRPAMVKYLAAIPVLALLLIIFSSNTQINNPPFEKEANTILDQRAELGDAKTAIQLAKVFEEYLRKSDSKESMIDLIEEFTEENGMSIDLGEEVVTGLSFDKPLGYLEEIVVVGHGKGLKDKRTDKSEGPIQITFDNGTLVPADLLKNSNLPYTNEEVFHNVYHKERGLLVINGQQVDKNKQRLDVEGTMTSLNILDAKTGQERYGEAGKFGVIELIGYQSAQEGQSDMLQTPQGEAVKLGQNTPNPWASSTVIPVFSDKATDAKFMIYNRWGKIVYQKELDLKEGKNEITVHKKDLDGEAGLYIYQLVGDGFDSKLKMELRKSIDMDNGGQGEETFKVVEHMPTFPGCDGDKLSTAYKKCSDQKMLEYIYTNLRYPKEARKSGVEGMVVVQFVVDTDGSVDEVKVP
jgi:bla regulator protein BlaR1